MSFYRLRCSRGHQFSDSGCKLYQKVDFSEAVIRIKEAQPLSEIIVASGVDLKRRGREWVGLCPFHDEKTPSFSVNDEKGLYYCRGCQATGDVIEYAARTRGIEPGEAISMLAKEHGFTIRHSSRSGRQSAPVMSSAEGETLLSLHQAVVDFAHQTLIDLLEVPGHPVTHYLASRNISESVVRQYNLGYLSSESSFSDLLAGLPRWRNLSTVSRHSYSADLGLVTQGKPFSPFQGRLLFPVTNSRGHSVALSGRVIPGVTPPLKPVDREPPKYYNSPDTPIFSKSHCLFGYAPPASAMEDRATATLWRKRLAENRLMLVEGFTDVLRLAECGVYAGAAMGTAISDTHFKLAYRRVVTCGLLLDGDSAGARATEAALLTGFAQLKEGKRLIAFRCPDGEDPDEVLRSRPDVVNTDDVWRLFESFGVIHPETVWVASSIGRQISRPLSLSDQVLVERALNGNGGHPVPKDPVVHLQLTRWFARQYGYTTVPMESLRRADQPFSTLRSSLMDEGSRFWLHRVARSPGAVLNTLKPFMKRWWVRDSLRGLLAHPDGCPVALQLLMGAAHCVAARSGVDHSEFDDWPAFVRFLLGAGYPSAWLMLWHQIARDEDGSLARLGYGDDVYAPDLWRIELEEWVESVDQRLTEQLLRALDAQPVPANSDSSGVTVVS